MSAPTIEQLLAEPVDGRHRGFGAVAEGLPAGALGEQGYDVGRGDLPLPLLVLRESALAHNLRVMHGWCAERGLSLAPHGKTSMAPQLIRRQLDAGAWGMTAATVQQVAVMRAAGARRVILANEVVGPGRARVARARAGRGRRGVRARGLARLRARAGGGAGRRRAAAGAHRARRHAGRLPHRRPGARGRRRRRGRSGARARRRRGLRGHARRRSRASHDRSGRRVPRPLRRAGRGARRARGVRRRPRDPRHRRRQRAVRPRRGAAGLPRRAQPPGARGAALGLLPDA